MGLRKKLGLLGLIFSICCLYSPYVFSSVSNSDLADKELNAGILSLKVGDCEDALEKFQKVLGVDPVNADAYYYLGTTYSQMEDFYKAVSYYQKALILNPQLTKIHFSLGVAYYQLKQYVNALESLSQAEQYSPEDAMVYYYQGSTYYSMKKYYKAVAPFRKVRELDPALTVLSYYWQGVSLFKQSLYNEAQFNLYQVKRLSSDSQLGKSSDEFLRAIEKRTKPLNLNASVGVEYDDNVTLQSGDEDASTISDKEDERAVVNLKLAHRTFVEPGEIGISYSFYQSMHHDLTEYNVQGHTGSLYFASNLRPFQPSIQYNYDHYLVDNVQYLDKHTITPSLNISVASPHMTQVYLQYEKLNYLISVDEDESNRSGSANAVGLSQYFSIIDGKGYIKLSGEYKNNDAQGDDWDYSESKVRLSVYAPTPIDKMNIEIGGEQSNSNFLHEDSSFEQTRKDTTLSGWIEFIYKLNDNWSVALNYKHTNNSSNIDFYEYKRNITSLFLSCKF
ncbi:tetratricopeptide repeat protein [bacterium]|nr:tetratricopeptide repeat protein [bacterium]